MNSTLRFGRRSMRNALTAISVSVVLIFAAPAAHAQRKSAVGAKTKAASKIINVKTEPKAVVWMDNLRRGTTDDAGALTIKPVTAGAHTLRVRARGFNERVVSVAASQRGTIAIKLTRTTDEAELLFQQAEEEAERGGEARRQAIELYRRAIKARPKFASAHLGLARALAASDEFDDALEEIAAARRARPNYPEASAVEGRILRELAEYEAALTAFRRAIREGRGVQPEAHTGIGLVHVDQGDHAAAVESFRKAIAQLSDTEPALYQLLGASYEKLENWKEAVAAYEKYLELAPEGKLAPAIRSIIDQLRQQAAEQQ